MKIEDFVQKSLGQWRSQRSAHHLAFGHYEEVDSTLDITALEKSETNVVELCNSYDVDPSNVMSPFRMSWEGESNWEENAVSQGTTVLVPIPSTNGSNSGRLLRDRGYAETIPAVGHYRINDDGVFILETAYENAMAVEKIWFVNPNFRLRVSLIKTSQGSGVLTASFSSEIRSSEPQQ